MTEVRGQKQVGSKEYAVGRKKNACVSGKVEIGGHESETERRGIGETENGSGMYPSTGSGQKTVASRK